jgi:hypothetical protein
MKKFLVAFAIMATVIVAASSCTEGETVEPNITTQQDTCSR